MGAESGRLRLPRAVSRHCAAPARHPARRLTAWPTQKARLRVCRRDRGPNRLPRLGHARLAHVAHVEWRGTLVLDERLLPRGFPVSQAVRRGFDAGGNARSTTCLRRGPVVVVPSPAGETTTLDVSTAYFRASSHCRAVAVDCARPAATVMARDRTPQAPPVDGRHRPRRASIRYAHPRSSASDISDRSSRV